MQSSMMPLVSLRDAGGTKMALGEVRPKTGFYQPLEYGPWPGKSFAEVSASLEPRRPLPRWLLEAVVCGTRSFIVRHTVQRNTFKPLGHRTVESQVMHLPVIRSRSTALAGLFGMAFVGLLDGADGSPSDRRVSAAMAVDDPSRFFLLWKMDGKGWLMDRPCLDGCWSPSRSWMCEGARSLVKSTGIFDAFSRTSASES